MAQEFTPDPQVQPSHPKPAAGPVFGPDGKLTRESMESIVRTGGSVIVDGKVVSTPAGLPSPADVAAASSDPALKAQAAEDLDAQIARLQAEKAKLAPAVAPAGVTTTAPVVPVPVEPPAAKKAAAK